MASAFKLMKVHSSSQQRSCSWRVPSPKFYIKLLTVLALFAYLFILQPASALFLPQCRPSDPSTQSTKGNSYFDNFLGGINSHLRNSCSSQLLRGRRLLLQDGGRFRPTPTGYPPPGDNQQVVPHAPVFEYRRPPP